MTRDGKTVAGIVDDVARGRMGHCEAMERLGLESYPDLVATMRANGRSMWAHGSAAIEPATFDALRLAVESGRAIETLSAARHVAAK